MPTGTLVLVVGPSGVGKDSLIAWCRARLDPAAFAFPRRIITRPANDPTEDHEPVTPKAFLRRKEAGAFALSWDAHELAYGVPVSILDDLAGGRHVVVNVSRSVVDEARRLWPKVAVVSVTAPPVVLAERIARRGREAGDGIGRRLARDGGAVTGEGVLAIDNAGTLEAAAGRMLALLQSLGSAG